MPLPVAPASILPAAMATFADDIETTAAAHDAALDLKAGLASPTFTGLPVAPQWKATGVAGANTTPLTLSGANATGAPTTGAHVKGEIAGDDTGKLWYCTVAGTPGTWVGIGGSGVATDTIFDAKGDLAVGTGADTAAKLTAGTNGHVLTADSTETTGLKWAAAAAGSAVSGCRLRRTTNQSIPNTTETAISFDTEVFDTDGYHEGVTNPTRLTVPAGLGGYFEVVGGMQIEGNATGVREVALYKNSIATGPRIAFFNATPNGTTAPRVQIASGLVALNAADYIELVLYQDSGAARNVVGSATLDLVFMSILRVG